jgi:hypothetical protein
MAVRQGSWLGCQQVLRESEDTATSDGPDAQVQDPVVGSWLRASALASPSPSPVAGDSSDNDVAAGPGSLSEVSTSWRRCAQGLFSAEAGAPASSRAGSFQAEIAQHPQWRPQERRGTGRGRGRGRPKGSRLWREIEASLGLEAAPSPASVPRALPGPSSDDPRASPLSVYASALIECLADDQSSRVARVLIDGLAAAGSGNVCGDAEMQKRDAEMQKLAAKFLFEGGPACSLNALETALEVERRKIKRYFQALAASLLSLQQAVARCMLRQIRISCPSVVVVEFFKWRAYDETPLRLRVRETPCCLLPVLPTTHDSEANVARRLQADTVDSVAAERATLDAAASSSIGVGVGTAKIVQSEFQWGMVLRFGESLVFVHGNMLPWLQSIRSNSAECIKAAILDVIRMPEDLIEDAQHKTHLITTDDHPSNVRAEQSIKAEPGGWNALHLVCDVHKLHGATSKVYDLCPADLSGLVNVSLSVSMATAMGRLRAELKRLLCARLTIYRGDAGADARSYRQGVLEIFGRSCSLDTPDTLVCGLAASGDWKELRKRQRRQQQRHKVLTTLMNGEWRSRHEVQHFVLPGGYEKKEDCLRQICKYVVPALAGTGFRMFPRNRWLNSLESVDAIGLFIACHGLLPDVFQIFASFAEAVNVPIDSAAFLAQAAALPEGSPPENVPHQAPLASDGWQELNRRIKLDSLSFLSSEPLPRLLLVRVVLSPLKDLIVEQHRLSAGWDDIQIHHEVRALAAGGLPAGRRDYRVLLAHDSLATRRCLQELSEIFVSERPWTLLPDDNDMSLSDMVLAGFRMLARAGAAVTQLLLARHRHYPYKTFAVLHSKAAADELANEKRCLLDDWSLSWVTRYPTAEQMRGDEALLCLHAAAVLLRTDISSIECKHASVRRDLNAASLQTWAATLEHVSALHLGRTVRRAFADRWFADQDVGAAGGPQQRPGSRRGRHPKPRKQEQGGGAWRAFVSEHLKGQPKDEGSFARLAELYRNISKEEYHEMYKRGRAAKRARAAGNLKPFGGPAAATGKRLKRMLAHQGDVRDALALPAASGEALAGVADPAALVPLDVRLPEAIPVDFVQEQLAEMRADRDEALGAAQVGRAAISKDMQAFLRGPALPTALERVPALKEHGSDFELKPMPPTPQGSGLFWHGATCRELAMKAFSVHQKHGYAKACEDAWKERHQMFTGDGERVVVPPPARNLKCWKAGVCVCHGDGCLLSQLKRKFEDVVKALYPHKTADREKAMKGFIVVRLHGVIPASMRESLQGSGAADYEQTFWWHVALQYLKPWRPTFLEMEEAEQEEGFIWLAPVRVDSCARWLTLWEALSRLDLDMQWSVTHHVLLKAKLCPGAPGAPQRPLVAASAGDAALAGAVVWHGRHDERLRRKRGRKSKSWLAAQALAPRAAAKARPRASHAQDAQEGQCNASGDEDEDMNGAGDCESELDSDNDDGFDLEEAVGVQDDEQGDEGVAEDADGVMNELLDPVLQLLSDLDATAAESERVRIFRRIQDAVLERDSANSVGQSRDRPDHCEPECESDSSGSSDSSRALSSDCASDILVGSEASACRATSTSEEALADFFDEAQEDATEGHATPDEEASSSQPPASQMVQPGASAAPASAAARDTLQRWVVGAYGELRFDAKGMSITAHCFCPAHFVAGGCRKKRIVKGSTNPSRRAQGRPLGLLTAWLLAADSHSTQLEHSRQSRYSYQERSQAREQLLQMVADVGSLLALERPRFQDEGDEPIGLP